ncbi:MAG: MFS transporter [Armatimonadetes bacterium]|nr:MFS transporter [Armatimonadota bacterium]MDE2205165.1 MFS transporter [Armatimonadota bacterium]
MKRTPLLILCLTLFLDMLGFGFIMPLLPVYITHYGGAPWVGGALMATFSLMQFVFAPIWGRRSDFTGRRPVILVGLGGSAVSYFFFGAAPNLAVLFLARAASGILTAASLPTSQAYVADVTPPEKRSSGMAMLGASFGLGFAFGPLLGGVLGRYSLFGLPALATPALVAAGLAVGNWFLAWRLLPESHTDRSVTQEKRSALDAFPAIARAFRDPTVSRLLTVNVFITFAFTAVESSFSWLVILRLHPQMVVNAQQLWRGFASMPTARIPADIRALAPAHVDWALFTRSHFAALAPKLRNDLIERAETAVTSRIFAIVGVALLITQGFVMRGLAQRVGEHILASFGVLVLTITLIVLGYTGNLAVLYIASCAIAVGMGVLEPSMSAMITHAAGPKRRGQISGTQRGLGSLARMTAPPLNNWLVAVHTWIPFYASAALMGTGFILSLGIKPMSAIDAEGQAESAGAQAAP